ncbi:MAG: deacylase [Rhodospirillaceae bacterium]|nr:deacylase [Rhodospirillaceae bacterium]
MVLTILALVSLCVVVPPANARSEEPAFLSFGVGIYDMFDDQTTAEFRVEYVFSEQRKFWILTPFLGLTGTAEGGTYGYGGIAIDIFFGRRFVVTPNFAAGIYGNGDGKDLGHAIEFRSGVAFAHRFDDFSRLGLAFHHISNAGLDERNPGEESLLLTYAMPLENLFGN